MLSAQRKEFEEKKKDETPYPRDFARWYALDYFLRPRKLKSRRFYVTLAAAITAAVLSLATLAPGLHKTHQAAPVSKAHAMFNQDCANCHDRMFQPVLRLFGCKSAVSASDESCSKCHAGAPHHAKQAHESACVTCHREHQGHEVLGTHVADRHCVECHGDPSKFAAPITHFNRDHPPFQASLPGKKDPSKIRFNHKTHLVDHDLTELREANSRRGREVLTDLGRKLECADCHQLDNERKYMKPIQYDDHCKRCHTLNVPLVGVFTPEELKVAANSFSKEPLPHREPVVVRGVLRDRLVAFAQKYDVVKSEPKTSRPLPWKASQPVAEADWGWASKQVKQVEEILFMNKQSKKMEDWNLCARCHIEKECSNGLPVYYKTEIPTRWHKGHTVFNHASHRLIGCVECHDENTAGKNGVKMPVGESDTAEHILIPTLQTCQKCHTGNGGGARNGCVACHQYHDRGLERSFDGGLKLQDVLNLKK